ncbi:MAG: CBS domain-containing protein [Cuniculiplasma sp.]
MVLTAEDIMKPLPAFLSADTPVDVATRMMSEGKRGFILVSDNGALKGIVTEWDLIDKVYAKNLNPSEVKVSQIMTTELFSVTPETPTRKLTRLMAEKGVRRMLVGNGDKFVGIITSKDIIRIFNDYAEIVENIASKYGII